MYVLFSIENGDVIPASYVSLSGVHPLDFMKMVNCCSPTKIFSLSPEWWTFVELKCEAQQHNHMNSLGTNDIRREVLSSTSEMKDGDMW